MRWAITAAAMAAAAATVRADDWPQWLGPQRDGVWRETGILEKFPDGGPKVRWRVPVGMGYAGPAVAAGKVFVADRVLADGAANPENPFARKDKLPGGAIPGVERILCLDEADGKLLWKHEWARGYTMSYAAGPRATPAVSADGKVYVLGAEGDLFCLAAADGKVLWQGRIGGGDPENTPVWGFAGHPLIDGDRLICLGDRTAIVQCFDRHTGKLLWKAVSGRDPGYGPPTIIEHAGRRQLIVWHPQAVSSLDPATGEKLWEHAWDIKAGLTAPTPRLDGDRLFLTAFYNGPLMLKLDADKPGATVLWKGKSASEMPDRTDGLHSIMSTPVVKDGHIYGVCSYGQLRCLEAATGKRVWETLAATTRSGKPVRWANAFLVAHGDRFFLSNELGELIIARLTPSGYEEIGRAKLLEPTNPDARTEKGRMVVWSHPAFANRSVYLRNDKELVCVSLAAE
jgi:outer membrane protein assembly factor BamB